MTAKTHYETLDVGHSATIAEIKTSYRQILLKTHPDKRHDAVTVSSERDTHVEIHEIQEAYRVLSSPEMREAYDAVVLQEGPKLSVPHSRPAHVVSLEDFDPQQLENISLDSIASWSYPCRCGNLYIITEDDLNNDIHIIGCSTCSETLYVGYELTEGDDPSLEEESGKDC